MQLQKKKNAKIMGLGGLMRPRHPRERGLGNPELKGRQQLEDCPTE